MSQDDLLHLRGSWLHRWTGRAPGTMPAWLLSTSGCKIIDCASWMSFAAAVSLVGMVAFLAFNLDLISKRNSGYATAGLILAVAVVDFIVEYFVIQPCRTSERKARAIARRASATN